MMTIRRVNVSCRDLIKPYPEDKQSFLQLIRFELFGTPLNQIPIFDGVANAPPQPVCALAFDPRSLPNYPNTVCHGVALAHTGQRIFRKNTLLHRCSPP
jgi:hypothetical protein